MFDVYDEVYDVMLLEAIRDSNSDIFDPLWCDVHADGLRSSARNFARVG
jgi:hypothetical protein